MAESLVQVTEGAGKKLHTNSRVIGANTVEDEVTIPGEPYLASYFAAFGNISVGTANDHILQLMAGASLNVRIRRIAIHQLALAGAAAAIQMLVVRLTTAGTGGSAVTPRRANAADPNSGAAGMTLPSTKGTEGDFFQRWAMPLFAAHPITAQPFEWTQLLNSQPIIIPAGLTNGIAIKCATAAASATVSGWVEFDESNF
jgi:hypothetical protein